MDRNSVRGLAVAAAGTLAIALSAATLSSSLTPDAGDGSGSAGTGGGGLGSGGGLLGSMDPGGTDVLIRIPFFKEVVLAVLFVTLVVLVWYAIRYWRDTLRFVAALTLLLAVTLVLLSLLSPSLFAGIEPQSTTNPGLPGGSGGNADDSETTPVPPTLLVFIVAGVGIVGAALIASRLGSDSAVSVDDEPDDESVESEAIGRAAGRAADRIEDVESGAAVDNEIYEAWAEMTALLDVTDPETTTTGEFADAAVDAGLRREDVDGLTQLFDAVRYGDRTPSQEDERRAVALLRRIEDDYATTGGGDTGRGGDDG